MASALPQTWQVYIADREADILVLLIKAHDLGHAADYLIRCLPGGGKLWTRLEQVQPLGSMTFSLPAGRGRKACTVTQRLRAESIELKSGEKEIASRGPRRCGLDYVTLLCALRDALCS
ncbi:hypothetical protein BXU06_03070 [Aquaspirillum sp. LM1]|nr:hypothetical protein BXU06_03070 [Aquaspirillum sp. LM1]